VNYETERFKQKLMNISYLTAREKFDFISRNSHNRLSPKARTMRIRSKQGGYDYQYGTLSPNQTK